MTSKQMPGWPNREKYIITPANNDRGDPEFADDEGYQRARAAYWEARCRVAVEALLDIKEGTGFQSMYGNEHEMTAWSALLSIGELPPITEPEKAGG